MDKARRTAPLVRIALWTLGLGLVVAGLAVDYHYGGTYPTAERSSLGDDRDAERFEPDVMPRAR